MILKILFTLFSFSLFANVGLPTLEFSNKAECAKQSQLPATSAFVLLDNVDLARAYYRILKSQNSESVAEKVKDLIIKYRQANRDLLGLISQRIFSGQIPLIEWNASEAEDALECQQQRKCQRYFENIEKKWHFFSAERRYFPHHLLKEDFKGRKITELSCVHLKKFGPLESELFGVNISSIKKDHFLVH